MNSHWSSKTIGILGHVGNQNLGDEAIIAAVIQNVRSRYPYVEIRAFTINPEDTAARHRIASFPIRRRAESSLLSNALVGQQVSSQTFRGIKRRLRKIWWMYAVLKAVCGAFALPLMWLRELRFLFASYGNLKGTELLIVAGSQQLNDYLGGPWAFPYTLLKWSLLARIARTKVAFLSVGAGPVTSRLGRTFLKCALSRACYRTYRDEASRALIAPAGVSGRDLVVPDLVYSLELPNRSPASLPLRRLPVVGINPLPFFGEAYWHKSDPGVYEEYVQTLARFAQWLIETKRRVVFFPTQLRVDPGVIRDIRLRMKRNGAPGTPPAVECQVGSFDDLVSHIASMDIVVATRYHGILIPFLLHKPVLGLAYHRKSHDLMALMGQAEFALDAAHCSFDALRDRFLSLESRREEIVKEIAMRLPSIRQALVTQYDEVLAFLEDVGSSHR